MWGYNEYAELASFDRAFNDELFLAIVEHVIQRKASPQRPEKRLRRACTPEVTKLEVFTESERANGQLSKAKRRARKIVKNLIRTLMKRQQILFVYSYASTTALMKLQVRTRQLPLGDVGAFGTVDVGPVAVDVEMRERLRHELVESMTTTSSSFERFLVESIAEYIPVTAVERYPILRGCYADYLPRVKVIVTALGHFGDEEFKVWAAEATERGVRLVVSQHGGSFPLRDYMYDFPDRIADFSVETMATEPDVHTPVRSSKYLGQEARMGRASTTPYCMGNRGRNNLLVIPFQGSGFALRAASHPVSLQWLDATHQLMDFLNSLNRAVVPDVVVKGHPSGSHLSAAEIISSEISGGCRVSNQLLKSAMHDAKFIICTYPMTTFTEAMLTGRPMVMLFDPALFGLHTGTGPLMARLKEAQIVFYDARQASIHVNRHFESPEAWWNEPATTEARQAFLEAVNCHDGDGIGEWADMLNRARRN
jgi:hypothetical protein